ncbi:Uncharacterised protein family (UPF0149) [Novosphingobium mathurense]|uniref:Uncharacterized protein family (UPF0149) n=1 Tax=Novosphingobium mathurense TaxID=428990 RepID=A0A1U6IMA7_9SPHN|nr:Uncharacterised protein family (UPF0149) [Novosphingobium mathurense]
MRRYNEVLASLAQPGSYEPLFDIDTRNDDIFWELWIEGFMQAMNLAPDGWRRIAASDDASSKAGLKGIAKLHTIANGEAQILTCYVRCCVQEGRRPWLAHRL